MTESKKSQFSRLVRPLAAEVREGRVSAADLVGTVLAGLCLQAYAGLPASGLPVSRKLAKTPEVRALVAALAGEPFLHATYWLSTAYALCAGDAHRKSLAMFFTPPSLTSRLLDDLTATGVRFGQGTFCDPACGGAAFLAPVALRMKEELRAKGTPARGVLEHISKNLFGADKDATLCELSKHFLLMALRDEVVDSDGWVPDLHIDVGDSLSTLQPLYGAFDVIICNPPFRKMPAQEVALYRHLFDDVIEAQPNLYALFMGLSVKLLKDTGVAALVTPTSYLSGLYFRKVRSFLLKHVDVLNIGMVSDRLGVFMDVEQETALTLVRKRPETAGTPVRANVSVVTTDGNYTDVGSCVLPNSGSTWPIPRAEGDAALLEAAQHGQATLVNFGYRVRIGSFVWNRDARPVYRCHREVRKSKTNTALPLLWSSDIRADGSLAFDARAKGSGEHRFVDLGTTSHACVVRRPSVVLQRVTSNDQPRRLVAAAVPAAVLAEFGGYVGENHTVILEQVDDMPALTPAQMAQLLATSTVDRYFRCISGATNVSAFELGQLALPDPAKMQELLARGQSMEEAAHAAFFIGV
jgi:adenine-specific DNA-methyltransferase